MKFAIPLLFIPCFASANLVITEVMSSSASTNNATKVDWFEITNNGTSAVNLNDYYWDDGNGFHVDGAQFPNVSIPAGQSIVVVEADAANAATFLTEWGGGFTVLSTDDMVAPSSGAFNDFSGLSSGGDQVDLYDASGTLVASATFGAATAGVTFEWDNAGNALGTSHTGENGAFSASNGDVGSPGVAVVAGTPTAPQFSEPYVTYWREGLDLSLNPFRAIATDPNPSNTITLTAPAKPAWLGFTNLGGGVGSFSGTPSSANVGQQTATLRATDNTGLFSEQDFSIHIFSASSPVLLNEYNAVGDGEFLNGGDATDDSAMTGSPKTDPFLGRIEGNGGDWFELVVVGNGTAGSVVDLRGWSIDINAGGSTETIKLSQDSYWATVPVGTILTFTEDSAHDGGPDTPTMLNHVSKLATDGYTWSNIWLHDPFLIDIAGSTFDDGIVIDNNNTQFVIRNSAGATLFGPSGEGIPNDDTNADGIPDTASGVNGTEVYKLEANPAVGIDPLFADTFVNLANPGMFNDGSSSSFGLPNDWTTSGTPNVQSFIPFIATNSPPSFTSQPVVTSTHGTYSYTVTASDPNGQSVALSATSLPTFLTFTPSGHGSGTLSANRTLTNADAGTYPVELLASDGQATLSETPQKFMLTVHAPSPAVILNEYNAVGDAVFLNGGDATDDSDGAPVSTDTYFGRVAGNGGDWFELVVTGDGSTGTTDLRGWTIQVGKPNLDGSLDVGSTIVLSSASYWSAVANGTILTFTEHNAANGGHDSGIHIVDQRSTAGWTWTNVWLGDTTLLDYTDEATNGYDISTTPVSGLTIDDSDTQFRILNAAGMTVFGPAGEGIAPEAGISNTDVFELENHPTPDITPLDAADDITPGYDDGASGSTFGAPNEWHDGLGGPLTTQDFSPYISASDPLTTWIASFGLSGGQASPSEDPDHDGSTNLEEYLFGGEPDNGSLRPAPSAAAAALQSTFSVDLRTDDPSRTAIPYWSTDLVNWHSNDLTIHADAASAFGTSYTRRTYRYTGSSEPRLFFRMQSE